LCIHIQDLKDNRPLLNYTKHFNT